MKKLKMIAMLMFMALVCVPFTGCSDDDDPVPVNPLVGTWDFTNIYSFTFEGESYDSGTIVFNADGTGLFSCSVGYKYINDPFEYQYDAEDGELFIGPASNTVGNPFLYGTWDVSVTNSHLELDNYVLNTLRFKRI